MPCPTHNAPATSESDTHLACVGQTEVSLQPWRAFRPDGVILFSDILTPLTGMGIDFQIGEGIHVDDPIRTIEVSQDDLPPSLSKVARHPVPPLGHCPAAMHTLGVDAGMYWLLRRPYSTQQLELKLKLEACSRLQVQP